MAEFEKQERKALQDVNYVWDPEAKITLTGLEFDILCRAVRAHIQDPEFAKYVQMYEGIKTTENIIKQGVAAGVIKEVPRNQAPSTYIDPNEEYDKQQKEKAGN